MFHDTHDVTRPLTPRPATGPEIHAFFCVGELERAARRVIELGGKALERMTRASLEHRAHKLFTSLDGFDLRAR